MMPVSCIKVIIIYGQITIYINLSILFRIADNINMLYEGKIVESNSAEQFRASNNPVVREFLHRMES